LYQNYGHAWDFLGTPVNRFKRVELRDLPLHPSDAEFLSEEGLPRSLPFEIEFVDQAKRLLLTGIANPDIATRNRNLLIIGDTPPYVWYCIASDRTIWAIDREDTFTGDNNQFVNSSLHQLARTVHVFSQTIGFEELSSPEILAHRWPDRTDRFLKSLRQIDERAAAEDSFWVETVNNQQ
jgi:hypothetical protein